MDILQTRGNQIVDASGQPVYLRGACVGGWMNMEEFINGYPGSESGIRQAVADVLGAELGQRFFDQMLDNFLAEDDIAFIKSLGATAIRLPLNYHHFESDVQPFHYLDSGFARLDQALSWCTKHGLYAILDLHAVQGWQNTDWHCDNSSRHTLFWQHPHYQDRFVALWEALADHYRGNPVVAGYNLMNEPVTNAPQGFLSFDFKPNWEILNRIYRRVVPAIRAVDPDHIIFLEGDLFGSWLDGLEPPFAPNLVYSTHNYNAAGFGPGPYPGEIGGKHWDRDKQVEVLLRSSGMRFSRQHDVPLWIGEFGSAYNGPPEEIADRLRALDDQLGVFNEHGLHWTMWTYKDIHVMGWVQLAPESPYLQAIALILDAKRDLSTDFWMSWVAPTPAKNLVDQLAQVVEAQLEDEALNHEANVRFMSQAVLSGYVASLMQPRYASRFAGKSAHEIDTIMQSFALQNCRPHQALINILRKHLHGERVL